MTQKVYVVVLANLSKYEEQLNNTLQSQQEVKLCCGIRNVITLRGPESLSYNLFELGFLSLFTKACGGWILIKI